MEKILTFTKTQVSLEQIDVTPNYRPSSYNSSFSQLVPALVVTGLLQTSAYFNVVPLSGL